MTQSVSVLNDTTFTAVNVHVHGTAFQCKLHAHTPVMSLIQQVREQFSDLSESEELDDYLKAERVQWALEHGPVRRRLDPETTLDEAGIAPGADLYLTHRTRTESYPVLRDDVAEGAAEVSKRVFTVLDGGDTRRLGVMALPAAVTAVAAIGIADVFSVNVAVRWPVVGVLVALTLMCASVAAVLSQVREDYADLAGSLCVCGYLSAAAAAIAAVPREPGVWHITTAGAAVATLVAVLWPLTKQRPAALHVGVGVMAFCGVFVGVAHTALDVSSQAVAAQLIFVATAVLVWGTQIARQVGKVRVNYIPTTGEPLLNRSELTVAQVSRRSTSGVAMEAMLNQETRVITTLQALIGMVAAAGAVLVAAAAAGGYFTHDYEWHMFALVSAAAIAAVAVGRGLVIRAASVPLMVAGPLAAAAYLTGRCLSPHPADVTVLVAGAAPLLIFVLISSIWAVRAQSLHSPLGKRRLEIVATVAVVTMFPLLVLIMEGWSRVRNR